jgi:hypothetical protein
MAMIRIEGKDLDMLREALSDNNTHLLRVEWRGDGAAFKVNSGCWSPTLGTEQKPY